MFPGEDLPLIPTKVKDLHAHSFAQFSYSGGTPVCLGEAGSEHRGCGDQEEDASSPPFPLGPHQQVSSWDATGVIRLRTSCLLLSHPLATSSLLSVCLRPIADQEHGCWGQTGLGL